MPEVVDHGEYVAARIGYDAHHIAQRECLLDADEVSLHKIFEFKEHEHRRVLVVRKQLAAHAQLLGIYRVAVESVIHGERYARDDHQRDEQSVAVRQLGNEEYGRQRRLHHTRHQAGHAHERERCDRHVVQVEELTAYHRDDSTGERTHEQRRSERTAYAACGVCRRHGYDLE